MITPILHQKTMTVIPVLTCDICGRTVIKAAPEEDPEAGWTLPEGWSRACGITPEGVSVSRWDICPDCQDVYVEAREEWV